MTSRARRIVRALARVGKVSKAVGAVMEQMETRTLLSGGTLDPNFPNAGAGGVEQVSPADRIVVPTASYFEPNGGNILIAGQDLATTGDPAISRTDASGHLDSSFGNGGYVDLPPLQPYFVSINALASNPVTHAILVVGNDGNEMVLARLNGDGTVDTNFGNNGFYVGDAGSNGQSIALLDNGDFVVAGSTIQGGFPQATIWEFGTGASPVVNGPITLAFGSSAQNTEASAVTTSGSAVYVAGSNFDTGEAELVEFPAGLDSASTAVVAAPDLTGIHAVAVSGGTVAAVGTTSSSEMGVAIFPATLASSGTTIPISFAGYSGQGVGVAFDSDGGIIASGALSGADIDIGLARITSGNAIDWQNAVNLGENDIPTGVGIEGSEIIVAGGTTDLATNGTLILAGFTNTVTPPSPVQVDANGVMTVSGGADADNITVSPVSGGSVKVTIGSTFTGTFSGVNHIVVQAGDGDDTVKIMPGLSVSAEVYGGAGNDVLVAGSAGDALFGQAGNDTLKGGGASDILVGGDGSDLLSGDNGNDVLIGGNGTDKLLGNANDDILVAGSTSYDNDLASLKLIKAEWNSGRPYLVRVMNLTNGTGGSTRLNGNVFLNPGTTVFDDHSRDTLTGNQGTDLFYFDLDPGAIDVVTDINALELVGDLLILLNL